MPARVCCDHPWNLPASHTGRWSSWQSPYQRACRRSCASWTHPSYCSVWFALVCKPLHSSATTRVRNKHFGWLQINEHMGRVDLALATTCSPTSEEGSGAFSTGDDFLNILRKSLNEAVKAIQLNHGRLFRSFSSVATNILFFCHVKRWLPML